MKLTRKSEEHRHRRNQQMAEAQRLLEDNYISNSPAKSQQEQDPETSFSICNEFPKDAADQVLSEMINNEEMGFRSDRGSVSTKKPSERGDNHTVGTFPRESTKGTTNSLRDDPEFLNGRPTRSYPTLRSNIDVPKVDKTSHRTYRSPPEVQRSPMRQLDRR